MLGLQLRNMVKSLPFNRVKPSLSTHYSAVCMPGTWIYLSSWLHSEVQLLGFLITSHQSVWEKARSRRLFQDKGDEDRVHWNFCLSISFLSSLIVAGISHTFPFSLSHVSEAVRRIYLMSVLVRKRNPVEALAFLGRKFLSSRRAALASPPHPEESVLEWSALAQGQLTLLFQLT